MVSTPPEIEDIIQRYLIFGYPIQIGDLRMSTSEHPKICIPPKNYNTIHFAVKNADEEGLIFLNVPHSISEKYRLMSRHLIPPLEHLDNMKVMLRVLIWLGESLTGEKAELIEYTEDGWIPCQLSKK